MNDSASTQASITTAATEKRISIVLPVYNEVAVIGVLIGQIDSVMSSLNYDYEILFVNDGSQDGSAEKLDSHAKKNARIRVVHFSRNFGHQAAVMAGLDHARGDAVIVMDSDLQDDPSAIREFVEQWQQGYEVVYAVRVGRKENWLKKSLFKAFYVILDRLSARPIPRDAGNFGLLDRRVIDILGTMPERDRFFPGLRSWVGFRQTGVVVERGRRHDDQPRVSFWGLVRLAKAAIFSFSNAPLTVFYMIAIASLMLCGLMAGFAAYHKLVSGLAVPGWTSTTMIVSLFGAINSLGIAILGEYVIRIYDQVRMRPSYIVDRSVNEQSGIRNSVGEHSETEAESALLDWLHENWTGTAAKHSQQSVH